MDNAKKSNEHENDGGEIDGGAELGEVSEGEGEFEKWIEEAVGGKA